MDRPRLLIATVVWNHRDRLPLLLKSIEDQTVRPDQTIVLDAASQDGVSAWLAQNHPQISTLRLFHPYDLSHKWRQVAKFALQRIPESERERAWIFFVSPEILLAKDVCQKLLEQMERSTEAGAIGPAVLRAWHEGEDEDGLDRIEPTELVESLGYRPQRSFLWSHCGQGESLRSSDEGAIEVFGLSANAVAYRADVLTKLLEMGGLSLPWRTIDALFFDLAWRAHWLGATSVLLSDALVWRVERKGDGTNVSNWTERVVMDADRRLLVKLHLFGVIASLKTLFARTVATLRVWPTRVWCAITRYDALHSVDGPGVKVALKQAKTARDAYLRTAQAVLQKIVNPLA